MNDAHSPMSYMGGEGPSSPKRKKMRQKYAPKACVSCRRSKLKCTGEVPCQRCVDNGKRCFYSEDQTAAEVLQNLSRPTPAPATQLPLFGNGNGHAAPRLGTMPQNGLSHRRPSDNGSLGMTMEQRMARMEAMMEALVQDRGLHFTPSGSLEREESVGHRSESAFSMPLLDPVHPALDQMVQQLPEQQQPAPALESAGRPDATVLVRIEGQDQTLPFPDTFSQFSYVSTFFGDIHLRHPCLDETEFRARMSRIITNGAIETTDVHFLALCYAVFACCDAIEVEGWLPVMQNHVRRESRWHSLADSIVDKKALTNDDDNLVLIQYLLYQSLYFAYADWPALAYSAIRTTCTVALQQNFHQQPTWVETVSAEVYERICVLWNIYVTDRAISLSCGRPASLDIRKLNVEMPGDFYNKRLGPNRPDVRPYDFDYKPDHDQRNSNAYIGYQTHTAELASLFLSELQDISDTNAKKSISMLCNELGPEVALEPDLLARGIAQSDDLGASMTLKRMATGLIVGRNFITCLEHTPDQMCLISTFVCDCLRYFSNNASKGLGASCTHQKTAVVAGIMLALGHFVLQDPTGYPEMGRQRSAMFKTHIEHYIDARKLLYQLAHNSRYAKRVQADFSTITDVIVNITERRRVLSFQRAGVGHQFDYDTEKDLIPPNIMDSFPYQASVPPLSGPSGVVWLL